MSTTGNKSVEIGAGGLPAFWRDRWREGKTGWDQGGPHRLLPEVLRLLKDEGWFAPGRRVLEPGCGRAHNGAAMADLGLNVTAFDVAPEAMAAARELYGTRPNLTLTEGDALAADPDWYQAFDLVFDRAVLCALPPEQRRAYVAACFSHLKPGALFVSLPFVDVRPGEDGRVSGPPYAVPMPALSELLTPGFAMLHASDHVTPEPRDKIAREMITIWRRRERALVEKTRS